MFNKVVQQGFGARQTEGSVFPRIEGAYSGRDADGLVQHPAEKEQGVWLKWTSRLFFP
ncbi:hypothetical protein YTPLAS18_25550 [Nitrospira sp.]|nr:hypothetical protein YTPLAS18_25550 [Nitrospira sp.]